LEKPWKKVPQAGNKHLLSLRITRKWMRRLIWNYRGFRWWWNGDDSGKLYDWKSLV